MRSRRQSASERGFRFVGRMKSKAGGVRVIETIGDVKVENDKVTELFGLARDISQTVEREAMAISRARLIRHMVEDMPVPVVVLDRALRVVGCSADWTRSLWAARIALRRSASRSASSSMSAAR